MGCKFYKEGDFHLFGLPVYPQNLDSEHHLSNKWTIIFSSITCSFNCTQVGEKSFYIPLFFPPSSYSSWFQGLNPFPRGKEDKFKCREKHRVLLCCGRVGWEGKSKRLGLEEIGLAGGLAWSLTMWGVFSHFNL